MENHYITSLQSRRIELIIAWSVFAFRMRNWGSLRLIIINTNSGFFSALKSLLFALSEMLSPWFSTALTKVSVVCSVITRSQVTLGTCPVLGEMGDWAWMRFFTPPLFSSVLTSMPALWLPVKRWHPWSGFWAYQGRDAFERTDVPGLNLPSTQTATLLPLYICSWSINNCPVTHRKHVTDVKLTSPASNLWEWKRLWNRGNSGEKLVDTVTVNGFGQGDAVKTHPFLST